MKRNLTKTICMGGLFVAISVMLQAAPLVLPVVGMLLSPFSTLPIAIAAIANLSLGLLVLVVAIIVLAFASIEEALLLLLATGLLGFVMGASLKRKGIVISLLWSAGALTIGMIVLTYLLGLPMLVVVTEAHAIAVVLILFFIFSLGYAGIWVLVLHQLMQRIPLLKKLYQAK